MATIKEIAVAVGVSPATVSRVLNYDATLSISAKKRQAVIEAAEALKYATPRNRQRAAGGAIAAQTLAPGAGRIALVHFLQPSQELTDPYYIGVRLGIENRCQALKIDVAKLYHSDALPEASLLRDASGVIAVGYHKEHEIAWLREHSRHLVFADYFSPLDLDDSVASDLAIATRKLLMALHDRGYRRIGLVGWIEAFYSDSEPFNEPRCRTYVAWMKEQGLFDPELCLTERLTPDTGYNLARRMLQGANPPEVVIACNDNLALGVYRAIKELGLRIPEDVAIAGFNDIPVAEMLNPPLTTVRIPAELIGETAVDLMLERFAGRETAKKVTLATEIIWRDSVR